MTQVDLHRTHPADAVVSPEGWHRLPSGLEVTMLPLLDATTVHGDAPGLFARLSQQDAASACIAVGGRLPTRTEVIQALDASHLLPPVTLPATTQMASRDWSEEHDARVRTMLRHGLGTSPAWPALEPWDRRRPAGNVGKHRVAGGDPKNERICGWRKRDGSLIQQGTQDIHPGGGAHRVDYGTTTIAVRDVGISMPPPELPGPPMRLGLRCLDAARDHLAKRTREKPGPAVDAQVSAFLQPCRRGGNTAAGILDLSGSALNLRDDDIAWCAAFASWCLAVSAPEPLETPHGYRAAVAEIVTDAKARGFWRGPTERPDLGWLAIWTRAGGDPLRGGTGHVGRVSYVSVDGLAFRTIEGNHLDMVAEVAHVTADATLRGWVVT